ncbi:hypothetical protein BDF22DRAFT_776845 [Syncephalis plumigaleata]|nr:hypothetical protein BDF22DRAFT_776845 [Syncephalis plumigaleata]
MATDPPRRARVQVDPNVFAARRRAQVQAGSVYNIWYNKWAGGDTWVRAETRVNIARDSGETLGSRNPEAYFCVFFAHGCCPKGYQCQFLHRIPRDGDRKERARDCFGRDRWGTLRDDMGGTGSFMRENHTLYIGRIGRADDIEAMVRRHTEEFGEIEKNRLNAEFAKEALMDQSMDNNEILNVRWATDDPNPKARVEVQRSMDQRAVEKISEMEEKWQKVHEEQQKEYEAQIELQHQYEESLQAQGMLSNEETANVNEIPSTKRARLEDNNEELEYTEHSSNDDKLQSPLPTNSIIPLQTLQAIRTIAASAPGLTLATGNKQNSNENTGEGNTNKRSATTAGLGLLATYASDDSDEE